MLYMKVVKYWVIFWKGDCGISERLSVAQLELASTTKSGWEPALVRFPTLSFLTGTQTLMLIQAELLSLWSVPRHSPWREREATLRNTVVLGSTAPPETQLHSQELSRNPSKTDTVLYFCKYFMIQPGKEKFPIILKVESLLSCATKLLKVCDQSIRHKAISTQFKTTFPLQFPL